MQGYVLAFRPAAGNGTIVADNGNAYSFDGRGASVDLQGGDLVSFEDPQSGGSSCRVRNVRLVQRWSQRLSAREKPLVHQLISALQTPAPQH